MEECDIERIAAWLIEGGLAGLSETELLHGFCRAARGAGMPLSRALLIVDTLHPIYEGRAFRWRNDGAQGPPVVEYGRTDQGGEAAAEWQRSPFYFLLTTGETELRRNIEAGETEFPSIATMGQEGETDYFAMAHRFAQGNAIGEMDCIYSQWTTQRPGGFGDGDLAALRRLVPPLALSVKCASLGRIAETLAKVYLGRDAGQRVLEGRIARGIADRISAVLWFSDLRGYTRISDAAPPGEIIPLLNDYAGSVIAAVQDAGGDVLKLIGDGILAIFLAEDPADACRCALAAEASLRTAVDALNERRRSEGRPVTSVYLGLHIGDVFYGNIGSQDRLDFTVVGPAVNEVARIASMCRSVDRHVVISPEFAAAVTAAERERLVSVGRFALRGVGRAKELFTIDPELL